MIMPQVNSPKLRNLRWLFDDHQNTTEHQLHKEGITKLKQFWLKLEERAKAIEAHYLGEESHPVDQWFSELIDSIDPDIGWDVARIQLTESADSMQFELILSAQGELELCPLLYFLIEQKPEAFPWRCRIHRPAFGPEMVIHQLDHMLAIDAGKLKCFISKGSHNNLDLGFSGFVRAPMETENGTVETTAVSQDQQLEAAILSAEGCLGEETLDRFVGDIKILSEDEASQSSPVTLQDLNEKFQAELEAINNGLPAQPLHHCPSGKEMQVFDRPPSEKDEKSKAGEGPRHQASDLYLLRTTEPEIIQAAYSEFHFSSKRFSKNGELFAYLKIQGGTDIPEERVSDSTPLENQLDAVLISQNLGCTIGGGLGLNHTYVELCLHQLGPAIAALREELAKAKIADKCWLFFHDSDLKNEWVAMQEGNKLPLAIA